MKRYYFYIYLILLISSCTGESKERTMHYRNILTKGMSEEIRIEAQAGEQKIEDIQGIPGHYLADSTLLTTVYEVTRQTIKSGNDHASIDNLECVMLSDLNRNNNYVLQFRPFDLSKADPVDTARFQQLHDLFQLAKKNAVHPELKPVLLIQAYSIYVDYLAGKLGRPDFCCFCYSHVRPIIYAPQRIWLQNEQAYAVHVTAEFNRDNNVVRMNGKEYTTPVSITAPSQKGVHELKGELAVKEKGKIAWYPFAYRILIE